MTATASKNELFVKMIKDEFGAKKVVVCPQQLELEPGPVCWYKDPKSPIDFIFKGLDIASPPFEVIERKVDRICVNHDAHKTLYTYTLIVWCEDEIYDTLQPACEDSYFIVGMLAGDKPVIRPK